MAMRQLAFVLAVLPGHGAPVVEHALTPASFEAGAAAPPDVNGAHLGGKLTSWRHEEIGIRPRHSP